MTNIASMVNSTLSFATFSAFKRGYLMNEICGAASA